MRISRNSPTVFLALLLVFTLFSACASKERISKRVGKAPITKSGDDRSGGSKAKLKVGNKYTIGGVTYYPIEDVYGFTETGIASWYGAKFHGKKTANGETYDMYAMTAAHKTLPLPTMVAVTNLDNGRKVVVRVNDRGPFVASRIIDLSKAAAEKIDMTAKGTARVKIEALVEGSRPTPEEEPEPVAPVPDFDRGEFYVQVGAFSIRENAERLKARLEREWRLMRLESYTTPDGDQFTRVQAGPYSSIATSDEARLSLIDEGFDNSFIVAK